MNPKPAVRLYLAAPLFSEAEKRFNLYLRDQINRSGYETYLPQEQGEEARHRAKKDDKAVFFRHIQALNKVDAVVAVCDGPDADSGTAWEAGYACAMGTPVIVLRTDSRTIGPGRSVNLMLEQSSEVVVTIDDLIQYLSTIPFKVQSSSGTDSVFRNPDSV
jgi:nucleoside 2-deoxyribosyltransferase